MNCPKSLKSINHIHHAVHANPKLPPNSSLSEHSTDVEVHTVHWLRRVKPVHTQNDHRKNARVLFLFTLCDFRCGHTETHSIYVEISITLYFTARKKKLQAAFGEREMAPAWWIMIRRLLLHLRDVDELFCVKWRLRSTETQKRLGGLNTAEKIAQESKSTTIKSSTLQTTSVRVCVCVAGDRLKGPVNLPLICCASLWHWSSRKFNFQQQNSFEVNLCRFFCQLFHGLFDCFHILFSDFHRFPNIFNIFEIFQHSSIFSISFSVTHTPLPGPDWTTLTCVKMCSSVCRKWARSHCRPITSTGTPSNWTYRHRQKSAKNGQRHHRAIRIMCLCAATIPTSVWVSCLRTMFAIDHRQLELFYCSQHQSR